MLEFLLKYPASVFAKGQLVFLSAWPVWVLAAVAAAAAAALGWHVVRSRSNLTGLRPIAIWALESTAVVLLLLLLWRPALSVATLKPQQNVIAVVVDDSRSMGISEDGRTRLQRAGEVLDKGLLDSLRRRFQVRLYRFGSEARRVPKTADLAAVQNATHIGGSLKNVLADSSGLPLGAVVVLSDGADTSGGIDRETISQLRERRVPVHTIGFGRERTEHDIEVADVNTAPRALEGSRLGAQVTITNSGYGKQRAHLSVRDGSRVLAARDITLKDAQQTEQLSFLAGAAGAKNLVFAVDPLGGEENKANNAQSRLVNVTAGKPRILYIEGEPRWEYKFIRRAIEGDHSLELVTILRTTQNQIYRQGTRDANEVAQGFPSKAEELFAYQGLIVGDVESNYFTPEQREMIREFANRRGGGVLFLGGRATLSDGGYEHSPLAEMLPVELEDRKGTFHRDEAAAELTPVGAESPICRLEEDDARNTERWKHMPPLADYQRTGALKPGAVSLLEIGRTPLLATQHYGRGRTAVLATSGTWRWQMLQPLSDQTHEMFWRQLLRWLVSDTPGQVSASTPRPVLEDETAVVLRAEVRNKAYQPSLDAHVEAHIVGPEGLNATVQMDPDPQEGGMYTARWTAEKPGSYVAEVVAVTHEASREPKQDGGAAVSSAGETTGRDVTIFRREDGVAENFHAVQNRELLRKLSEETTRPVLHAGRGREAGR